MKEGVVKESGLGKRYIDRVFSHWVYSNTEFTLQRRGGVEGGRQIEEEQLKIKGDLKRVIEEREQIVEEMEGVGDIREGEGVTEEGVWGKCEGKGVTEEGVWGICEGE